jgi:tetratricopeptide (TPR) repeat protein
MDGTLILCSVLAASGLQAAEVHDAVAARDPARVLRALAASPHSVTNRDSSGATPLHIAAGMNDTNLVAILLARGSETSATNARGWTALHVAAAANAPDSVGLLCSMRQGLLRLAPGGYTALRLALAADATNSVKALIERSVAAYEDVCLDARNEQGRSARASGDLDRAYNMLSAMLRDSPASERINFALGMVCASMDDYARAQLAFDRVLLSNPANDRARLELARSYVEGGQFALAKKEFDTVLDHGPPPGVVRSIEESMKVVRKELSKWSYSARAEAGLIHDSNVNVGPESGSIRISPIVVGSSAISNLTVQASSKPVRANGLYTAIGLSAAYDLGEKDSWSAIAEGSFYNNVLSGASAFESLFGQAAVGLKLMGAKTMFAAPLKAGLINYGHAPLMEVYGFNPSHLCACGDSGGLQFLSSASYEWRNYYRLDNRDGYSVSASESVRKFIGDRGSSVSAGVSAAYDRTRSETYQGASYAANVAGELALPMRLTAYARGRFSRTAYDEREALAPDKRTDRQTQFCVGVTRRTKAWGVDANYQRTGNNSSFDLYQYSRDVFTVALSGEF